VLGNGPDSSSQHGLDRCVFVGQLVDHLDRVFNSHLASLRNAFHELSDQLRHSSVFGYDLLGTGEPPLRTLRATSAR